MKKTTQKIPKGSVGIRVTVKITDPEKSRDFNKAAKEKWLAEECLRYLKIRLDSKLMGAYFK